MRSERAAGAPREAPRGTLGVVVSPWLRPRGGGARGRSVPSLPPPRARGAARPGSAVAPGPAPGAGGAPAEGGPGRRTPRPTRPCGCRQLPLKVTWGGGAAAAEAGGPRVPEGPPRPGPLGPAPAGPGGKHTEGPCPPPLQLRLLWSHRARGW